MVDLLQLLLRRRLSAEAVPLLFLLLWSGGPAAGAGVQDYWAAAGYPLLSQVPWRRVTNR
jgi:hypothetical protein